MSRTLYLIYGLIIVVGTSWLTYTYTDDGDTHNRSGGGSGHSWYSGGHK